MKLKTLKDFDVTKENWDKHDKDNDYFKGCNHGRNCCIFDLKQEAIKWVKHFTTDQPEHLRINYWNIVQFIKNFFNITEEDLK